MVASFLQKCFTILVVVVILLTQNASALTKNDFFSIQNNTANYDPSCSATFADTTLPSTTSGVSVNVTTNGNKISPAAPIIQDLLKTEVATGVPASVLLAQGAYESGDAGWWDKAKLGDVKAQKYSYFNGGGKQDLNEEFSSYNTNPAGHGPMQLDNWPGSYGGSTGNYTPSRFSKFNKLAKDQFGANGSLDGTKIGNIANMFDTAILFAGIIDSELLPSGVKPDTATPDQWAQVLDDYGTLRGASAATKDSWKTLRDSIAKQLGSASSAPSTGNTSQSGCCSSPPTRASANDPTISAGTVVWPFSNKNTGQYQRVDQGWDIQDRPKAEVYAIAAGTIHVLNPDSGNFGNDYPTEELDDSIGGPTKWVYYGHVHVKAGLDGKHVSAGQLIATTNGLGAAVNNPENGSGAPAGWLEIGFAVAGTDAPVARGSAASVEGQKMKDILINTQPGVTVGGGSSATTSLSATAAATCCPSSDSGGSAANVSGSISPGAGKGMTASAQQKFQQIMVAAGKKFDVDPNFVATFYYAENAPTHDSTNNADSSRPPPQTGDGDWREPAPPYGKGSKYEPPNNYGAAGPFQFIPGTWATYGVNASGHPGAPDVYDLTDAAFGAAKYLAASGGKASSGDAGLRKAAFAYNQSNTYGQSVLNTYRYLTGKGSTAVSGSTASGDGADCGSSASGSSDSSGYSNPFKNVPNIAQAGIDAGVDYSGEGDVHAIGNGTITFADQNTGWIGGNYVAYKLDDGAAKGKTIYAAENCTVNAKLKKGDKVTADTTICHLNQAYPGLETGWSNDTNDLPLPYVEKCYYLANSSIPAKTSTTYGTNFDKLMQRLGAPKASLLAPPITCKLPSGWPTW